MRTHLQSTNETLITEEETTRNESIVVPPQINKKYIFTMLFVTTTS
jgi:MFS family permease